MFEKICTIKNNYLKILTKLFVELFVHVFIFGDFIKQLQAFLHQVLPDDFQDFVLLEHFSGDIQRQVLGIHNTLDEI